MKKALKKSLFSAVTAALLLAALAGAASADTSTAVTYYRQAAEVYRNAARQETDPRMKACFQEYARYNACLAESLQTGGALQCRLEPSACPPVPKPGAEKRAGGVYTGPHSGLMNALLGHPGALPPASTGTPSTGPRSGPPLPDEATMRQTYDQALAQASVPASAKQTYQQLQAKYAAQATPASTALVGAARQGTVADVLDALAGGTPVNAQDAQGDTALSAASETDNLRLVKLLLGKGADPNLANALMQTALMKAAQGGDWRVLLVLLLTRGASSDPATRPATPANPAQKDLFSQADAVQYARDADHDDAAFVLNHVKHLDPAVQARLDAAKSAPPEAVLLGLSAGDGDKDEVQTELDKGVSVDAEDDFTWTPLQNASQSGHLDIVQMLLDRKANVNAANALGQTALMLAARGGHAEIVALLLAHGARTDVKDVNGQTVSDYIAPYLKKYAPYKDAGPNNPLTASFQQYQAIQTSLAGRTT